MRFGWDLGLSHRLQTHVGLSRSMEIPASVQRLDCGVSETLQPGSFPGCASCCKSFQSDAFSLQGCGSSFAFTSTTVSRAKMQTQVGEIVKPLLKREPRNRRLRRSP